MLQVFIGLFKLKIYIVDSNYDVVLGWGRNTTAGEPIQFPSVMQEAALPVAKLDDCIKAYEKSQNGFVITDKNMCASRRGSDVCEVCILNISTKCHLYHK